jgi:hypothetical protein
VRIHESTGERGDTWRQPRLSVSITFVPDPAGGFAHRTADRWNVFEADTVLGREARVKIKEAILLLSGLSGYCRFMSHFQRFAEILRQI